MANKFEFTKTYNEAIADASNNIGQKLFAYISKGKNINDRIREKFKKSLIFIGDEGQIYNPLTNTYVGIGQTAYTATISYIEDAHEKISTLSQMLASSMVSSIYANWKEEEWDYYSVKSVLNRDDYDNAKPAKIYATNEIVLKGLGDYDPTTKLAATREYAHITDDNATADDNLTKLYNNTYKEINKTEFVTYQYTNSTGDNITLKKEGEADLTVPANGSAESTVDYNVGEGITKETINKYSYAFATSGITVSLNKGLNKYLYSYTFTHKPDTGDSSNIENCFKYVGQKESTEEFSKTLNLYLTAQQYSDYKNQNEGESSDIVDENGNVLISKTFSVDNHKKFWNGVKPVYEDGYTETGEVNKDLKHQLFKQSANILTIDDKLTWSYISSAYSYTVNFSKEYTDNQVNMIYRELLGEEAALIPASEEQVKVLVPNSAAKLNSDRLQWNEADKKWTNANDSINESSSNLGKYVLDYSSTFVSRHDLTTTTEINADSINTVGSNKLLPWQVLDDLAQAIAKAKQDASKVLINEENSEEQIAEILFSYAATAITNFKPKFFNGSEYQYEYNKDDKNNVTTEKTLKEILGSSETGFKILENVYFMGYDKTLESAHTKLSDDGILTAEKLWKYTNATESDITLSEAGKADLIVPAKGSVTSTVDYNVTGVTGITKRQDYTSSKYKQPYIYKIIDQATVEYWVTAATDGLPSTVPLDTNATPLFVVNTSHVGMDNINLADGIQTLKEVAYVLDIITDGWGNQYDPEGNGILLTYTIANNHERIEDHEQRLVALEGGRNVVRAIYKDVDSMGKYVNLQIKSDTSWMFGSDIASPISSVKDYKTQQPSFDEEGKEIKDGEGNTIMEEVSHTGIANFDLSKDWYQVITKEGNNKYAIPVQKSYLYAYQVVLNEYLAHSERHTDYPVSAPTFSSVCSLPYETESYTLAGFVEFSSAEGNRSFFKDASGNTIETIATYTGQVGLGINVNVASTYTTSIYCDHTSDGFEAVNLNSEYIKKTGILHIKLPQDIEFDANIGTAKGFSNTSDGSINTSITAPYVNAKKIRFTYTGEGVDDIRDTDTLNVQTVSNAKAGLLSQYASEINDFLANYPGLSDENVTIDATIEPENYTGLEMSLDFVINTNDCVDNVKKPGYRTQLYDSNGKIYNPKYSTTNTSEADIPVGEITIAPGDTVVLDEDKSSTEGLSVTLVGQSTTIPASSNEVFYIRKAEKEVVYCDASEEALTDVKWVSTYVTYVVEDVKQSLKGIEFEAYQFSKNLISQLDGNFVASYSYYVAGLTQKDGKVTPIVRELPKDNITASTTVWGETTETAKQYEAVQNGDIDNEIAMDTPLFIKTVEYYEVPQKNYTVSSTQPEGEIYEKVTLSGEFVYELDKKYKYINSTESVITLTKADEADLEVPANGLATSSVDYDVTSKTGIAKIELIEEYKLIAGNDSNKAECLCSAVVGKSYRRFRQLYFKRDGYVQIDGADLRKVGANWKLLTGYTPGANEGDPDVPVYETTFYKLANSGQPEAVKKYISAEVDYQSEYTDGVGGNNFKVTAHITKLSDASEDNSGLVDAYDVRNTLDNMFEWVDLSRWDEETASNPNPVNTNKNEAGGGITAATRINDTKMKCAGTNEANSLGYPINLNVSGSTEPTTPTPESGDTSGDESEPEEGS